MVAGNSGGGRDSSAVTVMKGYKEDEEERSLLGHFFLGEPEEVDAGEEKRRRREQQEAYGKALREKKEKRDELRKVFMAQPIRLLYNPDPRFLRLRGYSYWVKDDPQNSNEVASEEEEEGCVDLGPFFYDEAETLAEYAAGEEKRKQKEQEEREKAREKEMLLRRWKFHSSVLDSIRDYDHKLKCYYYRRLNYVDLSTFDLDEESPLGPMRHTGDAIHLDEAVCEQGKWLLLPSVNVLSAKIASSDVGFPVNVYGTVIARDTLDRKCVYLFRHDRNHCQLINSDVTN